jgi:hypothetical protein
MSAANTDAPVPPRSQLIQSTRDWSSLQEVAIAVSVATEHETEVYVERLGERYRWSLVHRGGPYPLLRITARFLEVDYRTMSIGCRDVGDGYSALSDDPENEPTPDASAILMVDGQRPHETVESLIRAALR